MPRVSHILFDLDGTLTDPMRGITASIRYALQAMEAHAPEPEELLWCIGPPLRGSFAKLLGREDDATLQGAIALYREYFAAKGMYENTLYDDIGAVLVELKASGAKLFLATSKPLFFAEQILRHFGLDVYFDGAYGSALDGRLSNKAELIAHLLESESIDPAAAVMVGDREHDVLGAKACGIRAVGVTYGYGGREELATAGADHVVESPGALLELLRAGGRAMTQVIWQVDAFTDHAFGGNPAAVCLLDGPRDEAWMQQIAREMNLSETAFLYRDEGEFALRWFTPSVEVDLCGHATLASAHVLWQTGFLQLGAQARFQTKSGLLTAERRGEWIELDFPSTPAQICEAPSVLLESLGVTPLQVGKSVFDYLVEVESEEVVLACRPDFGLLATLPVRGVMVTAPSASPEFDFVSRFFAPAAGIDEDPVTGSAHSCLGPYWSERLGKTELRAYQASPRGGVLRVRVGDNGRVYISGQAVTVLRCELLESQAL